MTREAFLVLNDGDVMVNVECIESIRTLGAHEFDREGKLAGHGPWADSSKFATAVVTKSGREHFTAESIAYIREQLQVCAERRAHA